MSPPRTLAVVLAGGSGGRLELLTEDRAKPAVPYGGTHRLIDFSLSNCLHSGLSDVWVVQQHHPVSLTDHLANGRPWDLDRTVGGLLVLAPRRGDERAGWHQGTADALWRQAELVRDFDPDQLLVVSADAVYRLDYDALVREHREAGAVATFATTEVDPQDAGRYGVVQVRDGRVTDYAYKPDEPRGNLVSTEVFVFEPEPLLQLLEELSADAGEEGLADLGDAALPRLVDTGRVSERRLTDYWRDVGTVDAYWESHRDLLGPDPAFRLHDGTWPIRTRGGDLAPARVGARAQLEDALLGPRVAVDGTVRRSVLHEGVVVAEGAQVHDSVLLPGSRVEAGAVVVRTVVDDGVVVRRGAQVGGPEAVTLLGLREPVAPDAVVPAGTRHPEPDDH
jgi:glucose-1-phosphate adenylyltransferase